MKTLVLGLGNPILTDDGVGIHAVRAAAAACRSDDVAFAEASVGGLRLLDTITGYDRVILVDAIQMPDSEPGQVYCFHSDDLRASLHSGSTHDLSLSSALRLGRALGMNLPQDKDILIIAIGAEDVLTFGETCTSRVQAVIPQVVQMISSGFDALTHQVALPHLQSPRIRGSNLAHAAAELVA